MSVDLKDGRDLQNAGARQAGEIADMGGRHPLVGSERGVDRIRHSLHFHCFHNCISDF